MDIKMAQFDSKVAPVTDGGYSLVHILDGECVVEHDGKKYVHRQGDTLYYDARYSHSVTARGRVRFMSIFFRGR
jgi:quercetin dioxygenase-like cupin family protein